MRSGRSGIAVRIVITGLGLTPGIAESATGTPRSGIVRGIYCSPGPAIYNSVWRTYRTRPVVDTRVHHTGRAALRCANTDATQARGVWQRVEFNQQVPRPIIVAGWARLEGVPGNRDYRCSVYLDLTLHGGRSWPMKIAAFDPKKSGWQYVERVYSPPAPVESARVYVFLREKPGTAWFDDIYVGQVLDDKGRRSANLLQDPGFEETAGGRGRNPLRDRFFQTVLDLNCNAIHFYRSSGWDRLTADEPLPAVPPEDPLADFIRAAHRRGIRVWLTVGAPAPPIRSAASPYFPLYACVNGLWGRAYTRAVAWFTRYGVDGIGVVPDEWTYSNGRVKRRYANSPDPEVAQFYKDLPGFCNCPICQVAFRKKFGRPYPDVAHMWRSAGPAPGVEWAELIRFRYESTSAWIQRTIAAAKAVNPAVITDTMICVLPVCSDDRISAGAAWDDIGANTTLDCLQTDPYLLLHNYRGDSTHYYATETTLHLEAANAPRRAGVTLEACRLRDVYRSKDPAEVYGTALSCLMHGAREFFWWHLDFILGKRPFVDPAKPGVRVRAFYRVVQSMESYFVDAAPPGDVLVLYSRRSEDTWDWLGRAHYEDTRFRPAEDPKRGFIAHKNVLYWLLRRGYPFRMTFLEHPSSERLAACRVALVPFPLALTQAEVDVISRLAERGATVILMSELSPFDPLGQLRAELALLRLFGDENPDRAGPGPVVVSLGRGRLVFLGDDFANRLFAPAPPVKDPKKHVPLAAFDAARTALLERLIADALGAPGSMFARQPSEDVEVAVVDGCRGRLAAVVNWDRARSVTVALRPGAARGKRRAEGFCIDASGRVSQPVYRVPAGDWNLRLDPQDALLLHLH